MKAIRTVSVILVLNIFFLAFFGCSASNNAATINSVVISKGIYGYFLSVAENSDKYKKEEDKQKIANTLCAEYVAGNELIKKYSVSLSAEEKVVVSSELKVNWQMYSDFYKKYSVSKQDLCSVLEYESLVNSLTEKLYSKGGERELAEGEVKAFFKANYIAGRIVYAPFRSDMSKKEVDSITEKMKSMAGVISAGGDFASAIQQYPDLVEYEDVEHIVSSFDSSYPDGFFEKLANVENGSVQVLRFSDGVYIVKKTDVSSFFDVHKSKCIIKMKKAQLLSEIADLASDYKIQVNSVVVKSVLRKADK